MTIFQTLMSLLLLITAVSMGLAVWRLLRDPRIPDRAAAFDVITTHMVAMIAMYVVTVGQLVLLDAVIVVALLSFLGTVALARFIEEGRI
mgnify:CR=1 FL=1